MKILSHLGKASVWRGSEVIGNRRERRNIRFPMNCPVNIMYQADNATTEIQAISENVASAGLGEERYSDSGAYAGYLHHQRPGRSGCSAYLPEGRR